MKNHSLSCSFLVSQICSQASWDITAPYSPPPGERKPPNTFLEEMHQRQGKSRVCGRTKMSFINVHTHFTALHIWPRCIIFTVILEARQGMWWGYSEDRHLVNGQDLSWLQILGWKRWQTPRQESVFLLTKWAQERRNVFISARTSFTCHF